MELWWWRRRRMDPAYKRWSMDERDHCGSVWLTRMLWRVYHLVAWRRRGLLRYYTFGWMMQWQVRRHIRCGRDEDVL